MPSYAYRAYTAEGRRRDGVVEAAGTSAAEQSLWIEGLKIVRLGPAPQKKTMADYFPSLYRISKTDLILFTRQLATFVGAGIPMSRALAVGVRIFAEFKVELPLTPRILIGIVGGARRFIAVIGGTVMVVSAGIFFGLRTVRGRNFKDRASLRVPIFGPIVLATILNRFSRTLAMVLKAGVPLGQTFDAVIAGTGNSVFRQGLATVKEQMTGGEGFAGPLSRTGLFPPMLTQMVRVGEETGTLDAYLEQAADFYEEELDYRIRQMTSLIEPVLTG